MLRGARSSVQRNKYLPRAHHSCPGAPMVGKLCSSNRICVFFGRSRARGILTVPKGRLRPAGSEHRFFFLFLLTSSAEHARTGPSGVVHARQRGTRATPKPASCLAATAPGSSRPICRTARRGRSPWSSPKPARSSGGGGGAAAARAPQHPLGDAVHSVGSREWRLRRAEAALEAHLDDEDIFGGAHCRGGARV